MNKRYKKENKFFRTVAATLLVCSLTSFIPTFAADIETGISAKGKIAYAEGRADVATKGFKGHTNSILTGGDISVVPVPSEDNPSVLLKPSKKGGEFFYEFPIKCEDIVIETSVRFDGIPSSVKRIFTVIDQTGADYIVFGTIDKSGNFMLSDGQSVGKIIPGEFYDIKFVIRNSTRTYDMKLNGKTIALNKPIANDKFDSVARFRFHVAEINPSEADDEKVYLNYIRAYASNKILTDEELDKVADIKKLVPQPPDNRKKWASKEDISAAMKGNILLYIGSSKAAVGNEIKSIDDANSNAKPFYLNDTTMVPLRFLSENLGATVEYNDADRSINISLKGHVINFKIGAKEYTLDGALKTLPEAPLETEGRTYVPLRAVSEGLGTKVFWDKVGYVGVGDTVDKFDMVDSDFQNILWEAIRPAIFEIPTTDKIIKDFKNTSSNVHPRLMITADRLAEMKGQINTDPIMKNWAELFIKSANGQLAMPKTVYGRTDGVRMLEVARAADNIIRQTAFAFLLTGEAKYKDRAIEEMMNVCSFPDWNPYHFLDPSEICFGVSLGYDWLYNELTPEQRKTIEEAIKQLALEEVLLDYDDVPGRQRTWRWCHRYMEDGKTLNGSYVQNWAAVCGGGVTVGALAVADVYPELMAEVITKAMPSISDLLFVYSPDGGCYEGSNYWQYACAYMSYMSSSLTTACGTDYGMFDLPGIEPLMNFDDTLSMPTALINFDYSTETANPNAYMLLWLARRNNKPEFTNKYMCSERVDVRNSASFAAMIWYEPEHFDPNYVKQKTETYTRNVEIVNLTTQGYGKNDMAVGFMGRSAGLAQQHAGSFILDALGVRWSRDPGTTLESYYTNAAMGRTGYYRQRPEGHSTIVINPHYGNNQNGIEPAYMEKTLWGTSKRFAICNMTRSYAFLGAKSVRRGFMLDNARQYAHVRDEVKSDQPMNFYWFMQIAANINIEISDDGKTALLTSKGKKFAVQILSEGDYKFYVSGAVPLEESPKPKDLVSEGAAKRLNIHIEGETEINLDIGMMPLAGNQTELDYKPQILPIDKWTTDDGVTSTPVLEGIFADGELIDGFNPNTFTYEIDTQGNTNVPEFTAKCAENCTVEVVQPVVTGAEWAVGKVTVINKNNENERRIYYILLKMPRGFQTINIPEGYVGVMPQSLSAEHVPQPANVPENVLDGDFTTRWSSDLSGTAIDFDFGSEVEIGAVGLATMVGDTRRTKFSVSVSNDGKNYKTILETETPGNTADMVHYEIEPQKTRYMRFQGYGNSDNSAWFSPTEIAFYNKK